MCPQKIRDSTRWERHRKVPQCYCVQAESTKMPPSFPSSFSPELLPLCCLHTEGFTGFMQSRRLGRRLALSNCSCPTAVGQDRNKTPGDSEALHSKVLPPSTLPEKLLAALPLDSVSWVASACCNSWVQVVSCRSLNTKLCKQSSKAIGNDSQNNSDVQERPS